jgi:hypothetical protein
MKHWNRVAGKPKITLDGNCEDDEDRVVSIKKTENGDFRIREDCDRYFNVILSKEEMIEALQEAIDWVRAQ